MSIRCVKLILLSGWMSLVFCVMMLTDASSGSRQQKDQVSAESADRLQKPMRNPSPKKPARERAEQAPLRQTAQEAPSDRLQRSAKEGATDLPQKARQVHRHGKESKKVKGKTKAVVKPHTDLTYHGILEDPSRYDPRQNRQTAGAPDPQTPDLTHDHFQELDRNRDGKIDPVERAFGRLDMDRDLSTRNWQ
jgi:hypothetical protein